MQDTLAHSTTYKWRANFGHMCHPQDISGLKWACVTHKAKARGGTEYGKHIPG